MEEYGKIYKFKKKLPINKGWSGERKYIATDSEGKKYLLRIADAAKLERKLTEAEIMRLASEGGALTSLSLDVGLCEEGVYSVQSFIDGDAADQVIPTLPEGEQYRYGLEAGRIAPVPDAPLWEVRFGNKADRKIRQYTDCPLKYEGGELLVDYINEKRHLLVGRPNVYQHGDYHIGNMMVGNDGRLYIIDYDKWDIGDPYEEFNRIVWSATKAPAFASGTVDGYFDGNVPYEFWELLALYISSNCLSSLPWAIPYGEEQIEIMREQARQILLWYDGMKNPVPSWYIK